MSSYNLTNRRKDQAALPLLKSRQSQRRLIEEMEEQGIIRPADGSRPREVLISSLSELDGDDSPEEYDE